MINEIEIMRSVHISESKVCESNNDCEVGTICDNKKCTPQFGKEKIKMLLRVFLQKIISLFVYIA